MLESMPRTAIDARAAKAGAESVKAGAEGANMA